MKTAIITSHTEDDGRLCFHQRWYIARYIGIHVSWRQFKSDCHQTSSVIPLATGDEMIKLGRLRSKVGELYAPY